MQFSHIPEIQWKPLNGITLGQRQIDSNNRMILISIEVGGKEYFETNGGLI